ncbi:MAG: hypothetical protein ACJ786_39115, partial [Catenulispora sp.]
MEDLVAGDRIRLTFEDKTGDQKTATVTRTLSDKGLGPEIEDYVACWIEITLDGESCPTMRNVVLLTNFRYWVD